MNRTLFRGVFAMGLILLVMATSSPAAEFYGLGDLPGGYVSSDASGVSADGNVVVGASDSANGFEACLWTQASGVVGLGDLPGGSFYSHATGVSADGQVVVGYSFSASGGEAFRWTQASGMVGLGDLPGGSFGSDATGVSADGNVVVGASEIANGTEAFRWTQASGMVGLGDLPGGYFHSEARGVSADGSVVVGFSLSASGGGEAFRWTQASGMVGLGDLPGGSFASDATGVSADGNVVVGDSETANGSEAFRWTQASGMVGLGDLPGGIFFSRATGVSADGNVVVGSSSAANDNEAFRWTRAGGMQSVHQLLIDDGIDMTDWQLWGARDVSADGTVIVGTGLSPNGAEAWLARIGSDSGIITPRMIHTSMETVTRLPESAHGLAREGLENSLVAARHYQRHNDSQFDLYLSGFGGEWQSYSAGGSIGLAYDVNDAVRLGASAFRSGYRADEALSTDIALDATGGTLWAGYQTPGGGLQLHLVGLLADLDTDIERGYQNGSGLDRSQGSPDGNLAGVMVQAGWRVPMGEPAAFTPYAAYSWTEVGLDSYSETGGGFPARFDSRKDCGEVVRLGLEGEMQASPVTSLWIKAAYGDRLDDNATGTSGVIIDLMDFSLPGYSLDDDWFEADLGVNWQAAEALSVIVTGGGAFDSAENPQWRTSFALNWTL